MHKSNGALFKTKFLIAKEAENRRKNWSSVPFY